MKRTVCLIEFSFVKVKIPRKKMLKDLGKTFITREQFHEYNRLKKELEHASNQLMHVGSILDRILLKSHEYKGY